ncbi:MAG: NAD(P)-dependent dehydrogenase (short-subunit alcohol dehydrogenase family) [Oceanospirillaceae bacterium]|jgi:NAD(P)-dependent dehydrogenase (short-subunit alcohol dehydrogenase family)
MPTILITGANRGIGQALCNSYLADGWKVLATSRSPDAQVPEGAEHYVLDVSNPHSIGQLAGQLKGRDIDAIWNNAGVYLDKDMRLAQVSQQVWLDTFAINTVAPIQIAHALQANLQNSSRKVLAFTTSKMGSLAVNGKNAFAYRASKSALNMAVRCLAHELEAQKISCLLLHPGHVKTDMGGKEGAIDTATSVKGMRAIVDGVSADQYPAFNSQYFDYDGTNIAW